MMNVVMVGAGAVGLVVANSLSKGCSVRFAVDAQRLTRLSGSDLYFNDTKCDYEMFTPSAVDQKADLVIIATKAAGMSDALKLIEPIVADHTLILPLLNGVLAPQMIQDRYGLQSTLCGLYLGHTATRRGNRVWQDGEYKLLFGRENNHNLQGDSRLIEIKQLFDNCKIHSHIPEDMRYAMWHKLVVNVGVNQVTAALRCNFGYIKQSFAAQTLLRNLMQEAVMVAKAEGVNNTEKMLDEAFDVLWNLNSEDGSSMYQDIMAGRKTELDIFGSYIVKLAHKHGLEVPTNIAICSIILKLEKMLCK